MKSSLFNKSVYIVGNQRLGLENTFFAEEWDVYYDTDIVKRKPDFDFIAFTGGADIHPRLYNEEPHHTVHFNLERDAFEIEMYEKYKDKKKLGICRGGQLLNVLNGGKLWQHVTNHERGVHPMRDWLGRVTITSSVHHQMMIPKLPDGKVLAWTHERSSRREAMNRSEITRQDDPEVVWYEKDQALCFQGHPEFGPSECTRYFFELINDVYGRGLA